MKFVFGKPTDEPFDREKELGELMGLVRRGQPTAVIGVRRIGKTSILLRLIRELSDLVAVYISAEDFVEGRSFDVRSFLTYYSSSLIQGILSKLPIGRRLPQLVIVKGKELMDHLRELLGYVKITFNVELVDVELFLRSYRSGGLKDVVPQLLDLPQELAERFGVKFVVVIDEFQYLKLAQQAVPGLFHVMRSRWQFHRDVSYVVSGSSVGMLEGIFSAKDQPFYQFFYTIRMGPFDEATAINFLREGFKDEGVTVKDEDALRLITKELDGVPAWLNYIGLKALSCKAIDRDCIKSKLKEFFEDPMVVNIVRQEYNKLSTNAKKVLTHLAGQGGEGTLRGIGISRSSVNEGLRTLLNEGYVVRVERGIYRIVDPVIAEVLRTLEQ